MIYLYKIINSYIHIKLLVIRKKEKKLEKINRIFIKFIIIIKNLRYYKYSFKLYLLEKKYNSVPFINRIIFRLYKYYRKFTNFYGLKFIFYYYNYVIEYLYKFNIEKYIITLYNIIYSSLYFIMYHYIILYNKILFKIKYIKTKINVKN